MKLRLLLALALALSALPSHCLAAPDPTRLRLEQMSTNYTHFALETVVRNRTLRLWGVQMPGAGNPFLSKTNPLVAEQTRLVQELRSVDHDRQALAALLQHPDPKVRTLALGAIFQREDGRDLPLLAYLIDDPALTFTNLHENTSSGGGTLLVNVENPQTVGQVAQAMLAYWGVYHAGHPAQINFGSGTAAGITAADFAQYWRKYSGRKYSAGWFAFRMKRATRETDPLQPEYQADVARVIADMRAVPSSEGLWIQFYVLAPGNQFTGGLASDNDLIALGKKLGPRALMRFLQRQSVTDDPDIQPHYDAGFMGISHFILDHADQLLRPKDADALLACQDRERDPSGVDPAWVIGASLVQPARASALLHDALAHETRSYEQSAGDLAGALWRIRGPAELDFLVDWFYAEPGSKLAPVPQPVAFLWGVKKAARPDTRQLLAALVKDPRFDQTDWDTLVEILKLVNAERAKPLVEERAIYAAQPNGLADVHRIYPQWRNQLRHEFGVPEEPLPEVLAEPEQVLTQPAWTVPMPQQDDLAGTWRLVPSPDGRWLALASREVATLWRADTGELTWQTPPFKELTDGAPTVAGDVAWTVDNQLFIFDKGGYGRFRTWNPATHQQIGKAPLSGKPDSGVDDGSYSLDRAAQRMAFAGYNDLGCFDTHTGAALWMHHGQGGVRIPIALSADGSCLAVGGGRDDSRAVRLYDAGTGKQLRQLDPLAGNVLALALSTNGTRLITATAANGLQLWDTATGKLVRTYAWQVPNWDMSPPTFSTDGQSLAVMGSSSAIGAHQIGIFNTDTGQLKYVIQFQTDSSFGANLPLAFSPDGKFLYTAGNRIDAWPLK